MIIQPGEPIWIYLGLCLGVREFTISMAILARNVLLARSVSNANFCSLPEIPILQTLKFDSLGNAGGGF